MALYRVSGGPLLKVSGGGLVKAGAVESGKALLTASDLTWQGQAKIGANSAYGHPNLAIRYVGGQRRLLWSGGQVAGAGTAYGYIRDIIEYTEPTLSTSSSLAAVPAMTEVRRWTDWTLATTVYEYDRPFNTDASGYSNGIMLSSIYWDEANGVVWYTISQVYNSVNIPFIGATALHDNGTVTKYGPWFWRSTTRVDYTGLDGQPHTRDTGTNWHKQVFQGIVPVPSSAQSGMNGHKYMVWGSANAVVDIGNWGPGMESFSDLPALSTTALTALFASSGRAKIADYGTTAGTNPYGCHRNTSYQWVGGSHASAPNKDYNGTTGVFHTDHFATYMPGLNVNDAMYFGNDAATDISTLVIHMDSAAVGGTRVLEYWNGSAWAAVPGLTFPEGNANLTHAGDNVFYWGTTPPTGWAATTVDGTSAYWMRLRVTASASSVGSPKTPYAAAYCYKATLTDDRNPAGGVGFWVRSGDYVNGMAWVDTGTKHGLIIMGDQIRGKNWYGFAPLWSDGVKVDASYTSSGTSFDWANGDHTESAKAPMMHVFNPDHLAEVAAGTRAATNAGVAPAGEYDWRDYWPNIVNTTASWNGAKSWARYCWPSGLRFDPVTNQLLYLHTGNADGADGVFLQVFNVG